MKVLLDQGLPRSAVRFLNERQIDAEHVGDLGMAKATDAVILAAAVERDAIVGVEDDDEACPAESGCNSGAAYLFDVTTGQQLAKLTASDAMRGARFGASVVISGETVVVGAPNGIGGAAVPGPGAAYVFRECSQGTLVPMP